MIPAISQGQYDIGMDGITIRDDRKAKVDFSDPYMHSEMLMLVRAKEDRFSDAKGFAADAKLLVAAQPGTTPFYTAVYDVLDGNEANPRIKLFETFGACLAGAEDRRCRSGADRQHGGQGLCRGQSRRLYKIVGQPLGQRGFRLHLPQGLGSGGAGECRHRGAEGGRHVRGAEQEVVPRLQDGRNERAAPPMDGSDPDSDFPVVADPARRDRRRGVSLHGVGCALRADPAHHR